MYIVPVLDSRSRLEGHFCLTWTRASCYVILALTLNSLDLGSESWEHLKVGWTEIGLRELTTHAAVNVEECRLMTLSYSIFGSISFSLTSFSNGVLISLRSDVILIKGHQR